MCVGSKSPFCLLSSGLSHTPRSDKSEISYILGEEDSYRDYTKAMKELLEPYKDEKQVDDSKYDDCGGTLGFQQLVGAYVAQNTLTYPCNN